MTTDGPQPLSRSKGIALLTYGVPGAGKTRLAATSESPLILRPPSDHTDSIEDGDHVKEWVIDSWGGMLEAFQWIQQGGYKEHDWVWLDSISLMQDALLDDVMADALIRKPTRAVVKGGVSVAEYGPDQGEYKINFDRINKWVRDMTGLAGEGRINFGITAHPFEWYDPVQEEDVWAPWIQGKNMSPKISGYMNLVGYLQEVQREGKPSQRQLLTSASGFVGKDQFLAIPELKSGKRGLIDPTIPDIESAITAARRPVSRKTRTAKRRRKTTKE